MASHVWCREGYVQLVGHFQSRKTSQRDSFGDEELRRITEDVVSILTGH